MATEPKKLIYPFENPSVTAGLAAINATAPPFTVEAKHLSTWFKEGIIARYILVDDIRELWSREGFGALFEQVYGEAKNYTLIASCRTDMEWTRVEENEIPTYGVFCINSAELLYTPHTEESRAGESVFFHDALSVEIPLPEPVLPRYEAQKIYALIHGKPTDDTEAPRERHSGKKDRIIVDLLSHAGFTEDDFKGSIAAFQKKAARLGLCKDLVSADKNTIAKLLKSTGKRE
ncbi:hypothetical protein PN925_003873 [Morganella morganii]|uniref:Uncharacterized protein n=1 Tax=Morganella morganii TaxID=582 RepID=A0AAI9HVJ4_MORMO|nr:hypothetical protein [Morganella morganii]ELB1109565.1 hypothetical protein [Morganella morganii]HCQ8177009.1 hypothetical protein [Morganella morganii]